MGRGSLKVGQTRTDTREHLLLRHPCAYLANRSLGLRDLIRKLPLRQVCMPCIRLPWPIPPKHPKTAPNVLWRLRDHQAIPVWVDFNFPVVVVVGVGASPPVLTVGGLKDNVGGFSSTALAEYVEGSGTSRLLFEYTVSSDATSKASSFLLPGKERVKVSRSFGAWVTLARRLIRFAVTLALSK